MTKDVEALVLEKKTKIEQVQKSAVLQAYATTGAETSASGQQEEEQKSGRASKSLSPRKYAAQQNPQTQRTMV